MQRDDTGTVSLFTVISIRVSSLRCVASLETTARLTASVVDASSTTSRRRGRPQAWARRGTCDSAFDQHVHMQLIVPSTRQPTSGDRSFAVDAPRVWNKLPETFHRLSLPPRFKQRLKSDYFQLSVSRNDIIVKCSCSGLCCLLRYISCPKYIHIYIPQRQKLGQISEYLTTIKIGKRQAKCLNQKSSIIIAQRESISFQTSSSVLKPKCIKGDWCRKSKRNSVLSDTPCKIQGTGGRKV